MKKITIELFLGMLTVLAFNTVKAQSPIITSANQLHVISDSTVYIDANSFGFDPIPAGGANVNWDYTSLVTSGGITFSYEDPATAASSASYPGANEAMANSQAAGHEWFISNSTSITRLGYSDPVNGNIVYYGGGFVRYQFPFQAGDTWFTTSYSGSTTISFGLGEDSVTVENGNYSANVDAYGTVILPTGTIANVLRVHVLESFDLKVYMFGTPVVSQALNDDYYFWFTENIKDPILIYGTTVSGSSTTTVLRYQSVGSVGIDEKDLIRNVNIYPNPSNGLFNVLMSDVENGVYTIEVMDVLGKKVHQESLVASTNKLNARIELSKLNKGVYFVKISNPSSQTTKKIIIR